jgi:hypothetical protein
MALLTYNSNSLQTTSIITQEVNHDDMSDNVSDVFRLYNASTNVVPYPDQFDPKTITLRGQIINATIAGLETQLDTFRGYFVGTGKSLDIGYAAGTRRYLIAKVNKVAIDHKEGLNWAKFEIQMITASLGQATSFTVLQNLTSRTAGYYAHTVTFPGNAPYQQPVFTLTYSAISASGSKTVNVGNDTNGQMITVTRSTWTSGDILIVDSSTQSVQVNGIDVAFTGAFPEFPAGSGTLSYSDDFTSRSFTYNVKAKALYL